MPCAVGVEVVAAFKKAAAWGTAVVLGAGDGLLILPPSVARAQEKLIDNSLGLYFPQADDPGLITAAGDIPMYLRYDSIDLLLALCMGQTGGAPVQQGATTAYSQAIILSDDLDGLFATWALDNNVNINEIPSLKITGFTLSGEMGQPLQVTFNCLGYDKVYDSIINTQVTFGNVTIPEAKNRVLMSQGVFLMNDQDGAALADPADVIGPNSFELAFTRTMEGVYSADAGLRINEPCNSGMPEITLKLDFPRYTSEDQKLDWVNGQNKKLEITFTGALIEAPYNREFQLRFPNLSLTNAESAIEEGIIKEPLEFSVLAVDVAPTGMTITRPFKINLINTETADVLA